MLAVAWLKAVTRRPLTTDPRIQSQTISGGQSGTGTGFSYNTSVFPFQYQSTNIQYSFVYHRLYAILATDSVI
jgi:hypothetical protein